MQQNPETPERGDEGARPLAADRSEIERYFNAMFRHADDGTFVSLRTFLENDDADPDVTGVEINGAGLAPLIQIAFGKASRAARHPKPTVFCPPVATFNNKTRAGEQDLANGLALSVENDVNAKAGLVLLRGLIGPPTAVVASGGEWTDPATGEVQPKLHIHCRLSEPTRSPEDHARLKRARHLATALIGGDRTNVPIPHPIRCPGSVHRKAAPKLCRIVELNDAAEIHLADALDALEAAAAARGINIDATATSGGTGDQRDTAALITEIMSARAYHAPLLALSARYAGGGMSRVKIVETLQGLMLAVPGDIRDGGQPGRWRSRFDGIERMAASAVAKWPKDAGARIAEELLRGGDDGPALDWRKRLEDAIAELNQRFFVASMGGSTRVASVQRDEALDRDRLVFTGERDIRLKYANRHYKTGVTQRGYDIVEGLGEAWLHHRQRRTYDRIALIPSGPCPPDAYNLWRGWGVEPKAGPWSTIEAHLRVVVCSGNDGHYDWLIGWLAYCVQNPGRQAEVAVVLRGLKGAGKGMVGQMLMRIFRGHSLHITNSKHLVGNFNAHLVDALFLFLDEAFWAGDKQGEGTLKALITEQTLMIEPKGVDSFATPNRLKILMASNNDWVVPASADERRYFVLDVSDCRKGDRAYFQQLAAAIESDELPALLDHLLNLDIADFDHRNPPHTDGLNKQKLIGGDSLQKFWADCLTASTIVNAEIDDDWPASVRCEDLHNAYIEHAHAHGDRHPLTIQQMGVRLRKLCPDGVLKVIRPRDSSGAERPRHFVLNGLDVHREAFLSAMNIAQHDWPDA